ncbi:DNA-3-methyladenine glycosylase family protein [[Clostridium] fimetarium]|uniref:DNA-(apurinic or apyrimidinic site) lyase n=1 Tax=[Clostridium] fimetarium TaxID=99656 RepID=A0A1I0NN76_9FIRM|nr:DNA glycosylase [[Clostridium] fimetarium]SEW02305.1 N-glycosylase/DNA lyase [[Clostridium] fimetarium]
MEKGNYVLNSVEDFDVGQTLECGQCFHFKKIDENEYGVVAFGKLLHIKQENNFIIFYDTTEEEYENIWKNYFDLDRNYSEIKKYLLKKDNKLKLAMDTMWGVRILNQEFFEILISFIISQNKQIPHIKQIVATISRKYGNYLGKIGEEEFFGFPSCERMSDISLEDLKECKTGFRAPYIMDAVSKVCDKTIDEAILKAANMNVCLENLQQIKGVGEKIGNCVMLFGLEKREAFPIDVWIKRIMEFMYFEGEVSKDEIAAFAKKRFGKYGGYAQQYLFYYGREMKMGK